MRLVPEDFKFPLVNLRTAFVLWFLGDPKNDWPPLRLLRPFDMGNLPKAKTKRNHLADLKRIISKITGWLAARHGIDFDSKTFSAAEVAKMWEQAQGCIKVPALTPHERIRRITQLSWQWFRPINVWFVNEGLEEGVQEVVQEELE